jgi:flagellar assembly protein FliH
LSNKVIPKEQLSAYQRWELTALEEGKRERRGVSNETVASMMLPTAEEMEQMQQRAHQEGYAAGLQEGKLKGLADAQHMKQLLAGVAQALEQLDQQVAQDVLALSLDIAKQMLRQALKVKPGLVLAVVREAMNSLPQASNHPHLILHPEDAALVKSFMEADLIQSNWKIQEDSRIERGGCRIESANSEIDATLETRWKRIVAALGADDAWLE